ncbi:MAG TPA: hypothetical protein VG733_16995 [Chthoniobacteraceae bacterium]|nr:hypothetical protein [Chthoniobacteraceae bacterium]
MPRPRPYRKYRRGAVTTGRIQLIALYIFLETLDVVLYFNSPTMLLSRMTAVAIINTLWATVCVIGIWNRQNVARYFLFVRLLLSAAANGILELSYTEYLSPNADKTRVFIAVGITVSHLAAAIFLIASDAIRKLTKPEYYLEWR